MINHQISFGFTLDGSGSDVFITGYVIFIMFILQFPLWCYDEEKLQDELFEARNQKIVSVSSMALNGIED